MGRCLSSRRPTWGIVLRPEEQITRTVGSHLGASPEQLAAALPSLEASGLSAADDEFYQKLGEHVHQWTGYKDKLADLVTELQFHFQKEVNPTQDDSVLEEAAELLGRVSGLLSSRFWEPNSWDEWVEAGSSGTKLPLTMSDVAKAARELRKTLLLLCRHTPTPERTDHG